MRLSDEQINKAETSVRKVIKGMLKGKVAINWRDHKRNPSKVLYSSGSITNRQTLRLINDLKYYKSQVEEMQKALEEIEAFTNPTGEDGREMIYIARKTLQSLKGENT